MKTRVVFSLAMTAILVSGCAQSVEEELPVDLVAEQAAVSSTLGQLSRMFETEDLNLLSQIMAHDADMINFGTDASERWVGYEALRQSIEIQFGSYEDPQMQFRDQVVRVHSTGMVAWFSAIADWGATVAGETVVFEGSRFTGVMEKRDGNWVFVQFHMSVPVAGQAVEY